MSQFYTIMTSAGIAYEVAAKAAGTPIKLTAMSVGDGGGAVYDPDATATKLKREVWRGPLNTLLQDKTNLSWLVAELSLPDDVGGWYVREVGLWTDTGVLYAIGKYPESFKPVRADGAGKEFYIRAIFETSNAANVVMVVDDSIVKATRTYVIDYVAAELAKLDAKQSVRAATVGPITLSAAQTVDGVAVVAGDRVLVKNQASGAQNGIYVVGNGAWSRAADADSSPEVTPGLVVYVEEGSALAKTRWQLVTKAPITLDTTALVFVDLLEGFAPLASPTFTGDPKAPTPAATDSDTSIATTAFVKNAMALFGLGVSNYQPNWPNTSLNNASGVAAGTYRTVTSTADIPPGFSLSCDVAFTIQNNIDGSVRYGQLLKDLGGNRLAWRTSNSGTAAAPAWGVWKEAAALDSPAFTGTPTAPNRASDDVSSGLATTQFVNSWGARYGLGHTATGTTPGSTPEETANLRSGNYYYPASWSPYGAATFVMKFAYNVTRGFEIANVPYQDRVYFRASNSDGTWRAPLELAKVVSPAFTGAPTAPTAAAGDSSTQIATTAFVVQAINNLVAGAPGALDTLKELATALGNDANFAATMTNALATKAPKATTLGGYGITDGAVKENQAYGLGHDGVNAYVRKTDNAAFWLQPYLGFTPVRQGGGAWQQGNIIYLGWDGGAVRVQADSLDLGKIVTEQSFASYLAAMAADAVGSYGFFRHAAGATLGPGSTVAGSSLLWSGGDDNQTSNSNPPGTWRLCGWTQGKSSSGAANSLYRRIA